MSRQFYKLCPGYKYTPISLDAVERIVVFGDIHGDLKLTKKLLKGAGLARFDNDNAIWTGGTTYLVQTGDMIDSYRCVPEQSEPSESDSGNDIVIIDLFYDLSRQADKEGGAVILLYGNHELMNVWGMMDYVSSKNFEYFTDYKDPTDPDRIFTSGKDARIHAFKPGNQYSKFLGCTRLPAVIIGSNLFVHGGIVSAMKKIRNRDFFNRLAELILEWLHGHKTMDKELRTLLFDTNESIFWNRVLSKDIKPGVDMENPECRDNVLDIFKFLDVSGIIVGHVPQTYTHKTGINSTCSDSIWRVDIASSRAFSRLDQTVGIRRDSLVQYLEIIDDKNFMVITL